jgi:monoamine oxidase
VELNKRVKTVDYSQAGMSIMLFSHTMTAANPQSPILVRLNSGETIEADHVILTVSAGVLKADMDTLLYPPLSPISRKRQAIQTIGFGSVDKVFFTFDRKFWKRESYIHLSAPGADLDNPVRIRYGWALW